MKHQIIFGSSVLQNRPCTVTDPLISYPGRTMTGEKGFQVRELSGHIFHDYDRCWSCGACVSLCPTRSIYVVSETREVRLNTETCIACGSCINACSVKAIQLEL